MKTINKKIISVLSILAFVSCENTNTDESQTDDSVLVEEVKSDSSVIQTLEKDEESKPLKIKEKPKMIVHEDSIKKTSKNRAWESLVDIQTVNPKIKIDLKYATSDNFMKKVLYDTISVVYLQKDVAQRLSKCQDYLTTLDPNLYLLVYDGVRPVSVQYKMWKGLDSIPVKQRVKFVSNPANGSIHNYGAAVDLTICDQNGVPLDMGAGYDDIRKIAYPRMESHFLGTGELTNKQVQNRKMLRKVMSYQNFRNISTEWWHFNACTRQAAKAKYVPLK